MLCNVGEEPGKSGQDQVVLTRATLITCYKINKLHEEIGDGQLITDHDICTGIDKSCKFRL